MPRSLNSGPAGTSAEGAATASAAGRWLAEGLLVLLCAVCLCVAGAAPASAPMLPPGMATVETVRYRLHSDLPRDLARELAADLEHAHNEYARRLATFGEAEASGGRADVYVFARKEDYVRFVGSETRSAVGGLANTAGIFMSRRGVVAAYLETQGREELRRTLRHEAFHQYAHRMFGRNLPVWLNEGLAQLFEEGLPRGEGLLLGQVPPERLARLREDVSAGRLVDFGQMLALDDDAWGRNLQVRSHAAVQYNQAWAMVHFLIYAVDAQGRPLYRERFNHMLRLLHEGQPGDAAFIASFGTNLDGFRGRFEEYVARLAPSAEAQALENQRILAGLMVLLGREGKRFTSAAAFRDELVGGGWRLVRTIDGRRWESNSDPSIYFRDLAGRPMNASQMRLDPATLRTDPLPAIITHPGEGLVLTTRFYVLGDAVTHESTIGWK